MAAIDLGGAATGGDAHRTFAQKWPPMVALFISIAIAVLVLPSSLNLPQSNPSTTLEFAPVPPTDEDPPPPDESSNLATLGVAADSGDAGDGLGGAGGGM
ncbi:MAG TPA: hypothetical protein VM262_16030, partial [Acidimicrobiales bacterium]|nr:hypothetical protein [Acidimicrobiales bacterium]